MIESDAGHFYSVDQDETGAWTFTPEPDAPALAFSDLEFNPNPVNSDNVRLVTLTVTMSSNASGALPLVWPGLPLDSRHTRNGVPDSWTTQFASRPSSAA